MNAKGSSIVYEPFELRTSMVAMASMEDEGKGTPLRFVNYSILEGQSETFSKPWDQLWRRSNDGANVEHYESIATKI